MHSVERLGNTFLYLHRYLLQYLAGNFFFSLSLFLGNSGHIFGFIGTKLNEVENFPRRPDVMVQLKTVNGGELFRMVGSLLVKKKIVLL